MNDRDLIKKIIKDSGIIFHTVEFLNSLDKGANTTEEYDMYEQQLYEELIEKMMPFITAYGKETNKRLAQIMNSLIDIDPGCEEEE